jgi:cytochrome c
MAAQARRIADSETAFRQAPGDALCSIAEDMIMKMMPLLIGLAAVTLTAPAFADGASLYRDKMCVTCHGKDAKTPVSPDFPKLAGQNGKYLEQQMLDMKKGTRANGGSAAMKGAMDMVSEAEIKQLADYLSKLK